MSNFVLLLQKYGVFIVFINVLLEQLGVPIPAFPMLIIAGALAMHGQIDFAACVAAALLACLISDFSWYTAGRHFGKRILGVLCQVSLSPDYCVNQTEDKFRRWGVKSLIVSKFIPGVNTLASPLSGVIGVPKKTFLLFSACGSVLWVATGMFIGALFHNSIDDVLDLLATMGTTALGVIGTVLVLFMGVKYWERQRFYRTLRMARITVAELRDLINLGHAPVILDARSITAQELEPAIPGAILFGHDPRVEELAHVPREHHIIVYCSCPNEASAAKIAKQLVNRGFLHVRPLVGGLEAWKQVAADD